MFDCLIKRRTGFYYPWRDLRPRQPGPLCSAGLTTFQGRLWGPRPRPVGDWPRPGQPLFWPGSLWCSPRECTPSFLGRLSSLTSRKGHPALAIKIALNDEFQWVRLTQIINFNYGLKVLWQRAILQLHIVPQTFCSKIEILGFSILIIWRKVPWV